MSAIGLGLALPFFMRNGAAPVTYATWNPDDVPAAYTLSGDNLVAEYTEVGLGWRIGRATIGKSSGEHQAEITVTNDGGGNTIIGVSNSSASLLTYLGADTNGYGYHANGTKFYNAGSTAYGTAYATGAIITIRYNADTGDLEFKNDGVSQGVIATGFSGEIFITWSSYQTGAIATLNAGQTALVNPFAIDNQGWRG